MLHKLRSAQILIWLFLLFLPNASVHGADATSFDPTRVEVKAKGSGGVPVGTIVAWPVATNPEDMDNWLECNGQSISPSVYPELYAVLGGQVPDLRGLFLRGHGGNSAALGVRQDDAIRNIKGQITGNGLMSGGATGPFYSWYTQNFGIGNGAYDKNGVAFDASRVVPTAEENRPVNQAVRYLVRARP